MARNRVGDQVFPGRRRLWWLAAALVLLGQGVSAASPAALRGELAMGVVVQWAGEGGPEVQLQVNHVPGAMGAYGSGFQVSLQQLSWASLAGGLALAGIGHASNDPSYTAMGAMLAPMGLWGLYRTRDSFTYITGEYLGVEYAVRHYAEDIRYIHENHPRRRDIARSLVERHPDLHREFLWSLEVFRDPETESPQDRAFLEWYRGLEEK